MLHSTRATLACLLWIATLCGVPVSAWAQEPRFLTGPRSGDPLAIALDHVFGAGRSGAASFQGASPAEDFEVESRYRSPRSGATHIVLRQKLAGLEVLGGDIGVHVSRDGEVIAVHDRFASDGAKSRVARAPRLTPQAALQRAAEELGLPDPGSAAPLAGPGRDHEYRFATSGLSRQPVTVRLRYLRSGKDALHLVWNLQIETLDRAHYWDLCVDAQTGELLDRSDAMRHDAYRVFAPSLQNPDDGERSLEIDSSLQAASPFGWHDTDGVPGAESEDTSGNNAFAQEDTDGNNSGGFRPSGGPTLDFDFPLDLEASPASQQSAAITNLFFWTSWLHDVHYAYGFDEAAGNFQTNQYGNPGVGNDAVRADAQDGSGLDNAQFLTLADGTPGRMEMFLFTPFPGEVQVSSPAEIAASYPAGVAQFGPPLGAVGVSGEVAAAIDSGADGSSTNACSAILNPTEIAGRIALVDRRPCLFVEKVLNVQAAGAIGAIIANTDDNTILPFMGGDDPDIVIPSVFVSQSNGRLIREALAQGVNVTLVDTDPSWRRDSALSNTLIAHEYGHGVSMRRTGGPANVNCLDDLQAAGMGEGWSDFWGIALTANAGQARDVPRAIGTYVFGDPPWGSGFRNYQYSTDFAVNPQTYADVATTNQPHGIGEIWAAALWEMYWNLVDEYGFDSDLANGSGGNNLALQLVMDGLALQPCEPTFLDARDAILLADQVNNAGANQCAIQRGFARRGMGVSASDGGSASSLAVVEAFDVPIECPEPSAAASAAAALAALAGLARRSRRARRVGL